MPAVGMLLCFLPFYVMVGCSMREIYSHSTMHTKLSRSTPTQNAHIPKLSDDPLFLDGRLDLD